MRGGGTASFVFSVLFVSVMGCRQSSPTTPPPALRSDVRFKLIASGDTQGWIMPCGCTSNQSGGLLRRGTLIDELRQSSPVVVVDVGGAADGTAPYQLEKFRFVLLGEIMMDVAAHNLGGAEIAFGADVLDSLASSLEIPFISANVYRETGAHLASSHRLITIEGQQLLITGVVSPTFTGPGLRVHDPVDSVLQLLDTLTEKYDWLIVLAYLNEVELRQFASMIPEAHAVIGGPTNQSLAPERLGSLLLTSATNKGKFLTELEFVTGEEATIAAQVVELSSEIEDHSQQEANLKAFRTVLNQKDFSAKESGLVEAPQWKQAAPDSVAGSSTCRPCHEDSFSVWKQSGHAHAWERLIDDEAHVDPYCQQCHTTGYGWPDGFLSARLSANRVNVGCESCHGPSGSHVADPTKRTTLDARGQCLSCHDPENSPHFEFDSYWEMIQHD